MSDRMKPRKVTFALEEKRRFQKGCTCAALAREAIVPAPATGHFAECPKANRRAS